MRGKEWEGERNGKGKERREMKGDKEKKRSEGGKEEGGIRLNAYQKSTERIGQHNDCKSTAIRKGAAD
jgi:hypothetical protein